MKHIFIHPLQCSGSQTMKILVLSVQKLLIKIPKATLLTLVLEILKQEQSLITPLVDCASLF